MARLKPKSAAAIGALTMDQVWFLKHYGDVGMPNGAPEFPFGEGEEGWEAARLAWFRNRDALLATKFPSSSPFFAEREFDPEFAEEREETRKRLEERANARR
jgi:hypothetical protein